MEALLVIMKKLINKEIKVFLWVYIIVSVFYLPFETTRKIQQFRERNSQNGDVLIKVIRNRMEFLQTVLNDFREIETIEKYSNSEIKDHYVVTELFNQIKKKNNFYGKIGYEISLLKDGDNRVITPEGTVDAEEFLLRLGLQENKEIIDWENSKNLGLVFKDKNYLQKGNINWLVNIDKKVFFSEFNFIDSGNWYLKKDGKYSFLGNKNKKDLEKLKKVIDTDEINDFFIASYKGDISVYPDTGTAADFVYLHPPHPYKEIIFIEFLKLFSIFIFIMIAIKTFQKIILNYKEKIDEIENIAENFGYKESEFSKEEELIKDKIRYIRDQINEMKKSNSQNCLRNFILGTDHNEPQDKVLKELFSSEKRLLVSQIADFEIDYDLDQFILAKMFIKDEKKYQMVDLGYKSFVLIIDENDVDKASDISEEIIEIFRENFGIKIIVGVSKEFKELIELPKIYRETKKILDYKFAIKDSSVISEEKLIKVGKISNYYYSLDLEAKLVSKTLSGNILGVKKLINEIFEDKVDIATLDDEKIREFTKQIYNTLERIVNMLKNFHPEKTIEQIEINKINSTVEIVEIKKIFTCVLLDICKITKSEEQTDSDIVKVKIQAYMEDNYTKDISLENLSDYLGHSFKYTSILFKKIMGENFKNYLDLYRIERSKELMLRDRTLKIKEIAEMVGCNSSNTFIRMFRRYTGVSPGRYSGIKE